MATLAANSARDYELGDRNEFPMITTDIIYEGAATGTVIASGHARPLTSVDKFVGFAEKKADNSAGAAAAINVRVVKKGMIKLAVTGAVITDVNLPVYATDDNTFTFLKAGGVFVGFLRRFVSAGYAIVEFNAGVLTDPFAGLVAETLSDNKTLDALDSGKLFQVTTDAKVITLPAVAKMDFWIANAAAYGVSIITIASNASDNIQVRDLTAVDDKDLINTKATANRGDLVHLTGMDATGWVGNQFVGTWTKE